MLSSLYAQGRGWILSVIPEFRVVWALPRAMRHGDDV